MKLINVVLCFVLSLFSFECNAQPAPAAPAAPVAPQYPAAQPLKAKIAKDLKDKKEAAGKQPGQKRLIMHDAAIFLDGSENPPGVITNSFALALCQNGGSDIGYPVIGTSYLYHNFLNYADVSIQKNIPGILARFDIYKDILGSFYLFIPKSYLKRVEQSYSEKEKEELQQIARANGFELNDFLTGFDLSHLIKVTDPEQKNIKNFTIYPIFDLKNLFLQKHNVNEREHDLLGMWNFAVSGHGKYSRYLQGMVQRGILPRNMKFLGEYYYADAGIAGLSLPDYRDLLQFFIQNIHTHFLYCFSCYAGGYNTILGYVDALINSKGNVTSKAKPNFIVATGALTDAAAYGITENIMKDCFECEGQIKRSECIGDASKGSNKINYVNFFNALHAYGRKDRLAGTIFKDSELRGILRHITPIYGMGNVVIGFQGIPQVMFPGTDVFRAVDIDGTIGVITQSMVKVHELEKKPIIMKDKQAILIYPLVVPVEISITGANKSPFIFFMTPTISLQRFERINFKDFTFYNFIKAIAPSDERAFDKYVYIKTVDLFGKGKLHDMLIHIVGTKCFIIYRDEKGDIYYKVSDRVEKLNEVFQMISQDQFINAAVNYFSILGIKEKFAFDLFEQLLSQNELIALTKGIEELKDRKNGKKSNNDKKEDEHSHNAWTALHGQVADLLSISSEANIDKAAALIAQRNLDVDGKNADGESLRDLADAMNRSSRAAIKYPKSWQSLIKAMGVKPQGPQALWTKEHEEVAHLFSMSSAQNIDRAGGIIMAKKLDVDVKNVDGESLRDLADVMNRSSRAAIKYPKSWNALMKAMASKPQGPQAVWTKEHEEVAHLLSISSAQNIDKAADMIMAKKLNVKSKNADDETLKDMAESMNRASKASVKYPDAWNKLMKVLD